MKRFIGVAAAGLLLASTAAVARNTVETIPVKDEESAERLSRGVVVPYTWAAVDYTKTTHEPKGAGNAEIDDTLIGLSGSFLVTPDIFVIGGYATGQTEAIFGEKLDVVTMYVGGGYRMAWSPTLDLNTTLSVVQGEVKDTATINSDVDDTGFRLAGGVRTVLIDKLEVGGNLAYTDVDDLDYFSGLSLQGTALYTIIPQLAAGLDVTVGDNQTGFGVRARWAF